MTAGGDIFGTENSRLDVFAEKIFVGIGRHCSIWRQVAALGAHDDFVTIETFRGKLPDGRADTALAALKPVVNGGVDHVDAALDRRDGRCGIALIGFCVRLSEVGADSDRGEHHSLRFSKMTVGGAARKLLRVTYRSFFGGGFAHDAPSGDGAGPGAGFVSASLAFGASRREHARRILR